MAEENPEQVAATVGEFLTAHLGAASAQVPRNEKSGMSVATRHTAGARQRGSCFYSVIRERSRRALVTAWPCPSLLK